MIQVLSEFCVQEKEEEDKQIFEYRQRSLRLSIQHPKAKNLNNLYIITTFSYQDSRSSSKINLCKFIVPKIHRCEAKHIDLWNQNLTLDAFKAIVSAKHVRQLYLEDINIYANDDNDEFPVEYIIQHCLNASSITVNHIKSSNIICTKNNSSILADLFLNSKLKTFCIGGLNEHLNPQDFCTFMKNNGASGSRFTLSFKSNPSHEYISNLKKQIDVTKNFWLPSRGKPIVELILPKKLIKKVHFLSNF
uniref:Uncharacterized protein n=1 Tax=Panagrolaimus superbus TaxID=310955 RepID=A0A914YZW0_9BILA